MVSKSAARFGRMLVPALILSMIACDDAGTGPDLEAAFAPGGKPGKGGGKAGNLIAYVSTINASIHVVRQDGTGDRRVTEPGALEQDRYPDFAPGGRTILFTRQDDMNGRSELYTIGVDGRKLSQLTSFGVNTREGRYSPDGERIAFISSLNGSPDLYVMNANGTGLVQLTDTPAYEGSPTWSPDGTRLAYHAPGQYSGTTAIYLINVDGSENAVLFSCGWFCGNPRWAPDRDVLVFESQELPDLWKLYYVAFNDYEVTGFTTVEPSPVGINRTGGWSPDGSRFVFASNRGGIEEDLYVVDATGSVVPLLEAAGREIMPAWSR